MKDKKAQTYPQQKTATLILVAFAIVVVILILVYFDVPSKIKAAFPDFTDGQEAEDLEIVAPEDVKDQPQLVTADDLAEAEVSPELEEALIHSMNVRYHVYVELLAEDKAQPFIYIYKKEADRKYYFRWDYVKKEWVKLDSEPSLRAYVILRNPESLSRFGIIVEDEESE